MSRPNASDMRLPTGTGSANTTAFTRGCERSTSRYQQWAFSVNLNGAQFPSGASDPTRERKGASLPVLTRSGYEYRLALATSSPHCESLGAQTCRNYFYS